MGTGSVDVALGTYKRKAKEKKENKVILIFYRGAFWGSGSEIDPKEDGSGHTGIIYQNVETYAKQLNLNVTGILIAPDVTQDAGVARGFIFLKENYIEGDLVLVYGYSYGGDNAVNMTEKAEESGIPIDFMIIVDSADGPLLNISVDTSVPENVKYTVNIYQTKHSRILSRGYEHTAEGSNMVVNIDATAEDIEHSNIQEKKEALINQYYYCQLLTWCAKQLLSE